MRLSQTDTVRMFTIVFAMQFPERSHWVAERAGKEGLSKMRLALARPTPNGAAKSPPSRTDRSTLAMTRKATTIDARVARVCGAQEPGVSTNADHEENVLEIGKRILPRHRDGGIPLHVP